jgi:hypothetical protein
VTGEGGNETEWLLLRPNVDVMEDERSLPPPPPPPNKEETPPANGREEDEEAGMDMEDDDPCAGR